MAPYAAQYQMTGAAAPMQAPLVTMPVPSATAAPQATYSYGGTPLTTATFGAPSYAASPMYTTPSYGAQPMAMPIMAPTTTLTTYQPPVVLPSAPSMVAYPTASAMAGNYQFTAPYQASSTAPPATSTWGAAATSVGGAVTGATEAVGSAATGVVSTVGGGMQTAADTIGGVVTSSTTVMSGKSQKLGKKKLSGKKKKSGCC